MSSSLKPFGFGCLATALALLAFTQWGPAQDVKETKEQVVQQREYYQVSNPGKGVLASVGSEGWDLVAVTSTAGDNVVTYYFQRLK
jgi:hypothetical protein